MIPAPRLRSGSPRLSLGLGGAGEQLRTPSGRTAAGSGSSKRGRGLGLNLEGFFQRSGHSWCSAPVQAVGAGAGFGIWAALRYGAVPVPSAGVSIKSHGGGGCFFGVLFFHGFLPRLSGCAGNCGAGVYPAAETAGSVEVCGVVPVVAGGAGRDPEMASPSSSSPGLGKKPPLVSAQAPGKACRRVCPLARGRASKPSSAQG